jgi:hypothetical protein
MELQEYGEPGYAVVDVEALILGPIVRVVEQVGVVLVSANTGQEIMGEKHIVYQPHDEFRLSWWYRQPQEVVEYASSAYRRITGDDPVHNDPMVHPTWCAVRTRLRRILRHRAIKVFAKGAALERTVFGKAFNIYDLEWTGCPKYPLTIHDPLEECRFFANYIPELQRLHENQVAPQQSMEEEEPTRLVVPQKQEPTRLAVPAKKEPTKLV